MESPVKTCQETDCTNLVRARGLCNRHYEMWRATRFPCSVEGCDRGARARGMCSMHYFRFRETGDAGEGTSRRRGPRPCKVDGCPLEAITRDDLCTNHRRRKRLYGQEDGSFVTHKRCIVCGGAAVAAPRSSDHCRDHYIEYVKRLVANGEDIASTSSSGYRYITIFKNKYAEHAVVMESMLGRPLMPGESVHHKNGVRGDNRPDNLELWVTPQRYGQRVDDLVAWVVDQYPAYVAEAMRIKDA